MAGQKNKYNPALHPSLQMRTRAFTHTHTHTYVHVQAQTHARTRARAHTYSHTHARTRSFLRSEDVAPGLRNIVVLAEISRELVPLRNAYKAPGQRASIRLVGGQEYQLAGGRVLPLKDSIRLHNLELTSSVAGDGRWACTGVCAPQSACAAKPAIGLAVPLHPLSCCSGQRALCLHQVQATRPPGHQTVGCPPLQPPPLLHPTAVANAPFPQQMNTKPLYVVRGDLFANEIKSTKEPTSVQVGGELSGGMGMAQTVTLPLAAPAAKALIHL